MTAKITDIVSDAAGFAPVTLPLSFILDTIAAAGNRPLAVSVSKTADDKWRCASREAEMHLAVLKKMGRAEVEIRIY